MTLAIGENMAGKDAKKIPLELRDMYEDVRVALVDPSTGVDHPHYVIRQLVLDAFKQFVALSGREPQIVYIPAALESALQIDFARSLNRHGKLREVHRDRIFNCRPIWNADEFRFE